MNNVVVIIHPGEADEDGPLFSAAVAESEKIGPLRARDMIPKAWGGIFQRRFVPAYELLPNSTELALELAQKGITHLALLTGDCHEADPFYFGKGELVNGMSIACFYSEATDLYIFMHCPNCGQIVVTWLAAQQEVWSANDLGKTQEARTIH